MSEEHIPAQGPVDVNVMGWISADDELPPMCVENETRYSRAVLCWCPTWYDEPTIGRCLHYSSGGHEWRIGGSPSAAKVTHWMPLPAAPNAVLTRGAEDIEKVTGISAVELKA